MDILQYITNPHLLPPHLFAIFIYARIVFTVIFLIMIALIIYFAFTSTMIEEKYLKDFNEFAKASPYQDIKIAEDWARLKERSKDEEESERKLAIVEMDDVLDYILGEVGVKGEDLDEKLEVVTNDIIENKEELGKAHETKKELVYNPNRDLSASEAEELVSIYEKSLSDLDLL